MKGYDELRGFEHLYLEDSFVLGIEETPNEVRFEVEAVLTEGHPRWTEPKPNEAHTYMRLTLVFPDAREVWWEEHSMKAIRGSGGELDFGNVDSMRWQGNHYELAGEWGRIHIQSEPPQVIELQNR